MVLETEQRMVSCFIFVHFFPPDVTAGSQTSKQKGLSSVFSPCLCTLAVGFGAAVKPGLAGGEAAPVQDRVVPAGYSPTGQYAGKACSTALFTKFLSYEGLLFSLGCRPSVLLCLICFWKCLSELALVGCSYCSGLMQTALEILCANLSNNFLNISKSSSKSLDS